MTIKMTVGDLVDLFTTEKERVSDMRLNRVGNASNNNAQIRKCDFVLYLLCALDANDTLEVEGCWKDGEIRDYALANAGSVVECLVKAALSGKGNRHEKAWNECDADVRYGIVDYEVKFSGESHYLATPARGDRATLLVNRSGVSIIRKVDVANAVNKRGRLPATGLFGNRNHPTVKLLENFFGLVGGIDGEGEDNGDGDL